MGKFTHDGLTYKKGVNDSSAEWLLIDLQDRGEKFITTIKYLNKHFEQLMKSGIEIIGNIYETPELIN